MRNTIRSILDRQLPPLWASVLQDFVLPLMFFLWCIAMIGGPQ